MQVATKDIVTLAMVSNVQKPAPNGNLPATNGTSSSINNRVIGKVGGGGKNHLGVGRKVVKKLCQNGLVNGCGTRYDHHLSPSPTTPPQPSLPPARVTTNQMKTKGAHSNEEGGGSSTSLGDQSQRRRLVCPELAITYTGTVMSNRVGYLVSSQRKLDTKLTSLSRKLREKQLHGVLSHARRQLNFQTGSSASEGVHHKRGNLVGSLDSTTTKSCSESSDASSSDGRIDKVDNVMETEGLPKTHCEQSLPIQVDGASDHTCSSSLASLCLDQPVASSSNTPADILKAPPYHTAVVRNDSKDDVFREELVSLSSTTELRGKRGGGGSYLGGSMRRIHQQLMSLKSLVDDDITDSSSDEEEDGNQMSKRETCKYNWERTRSLIGSRWAWLHHRLTTLNKDLCRLEHEIQRRPTKERFSFARPDPSHPPSWFALPSNGSLLEQLNRTSGNGSTTPLLSAAMSNLQQKGSGNKTSIKPSNGYTTDHAAATAAPANAGNGPPKTHAHYYPQLLLSEANIGSKLQVKDLLSPSPLGRNFVFFDDTGCSSARTRALERKAHRRIVRKHNSHHHGDSQNDVTTSGVDPSPHPLLTLPHELPSRVLLDAAVQRVLSEHSYAQLPLNKRRKAAAKLPHISTPRTMIIPPRAHYDHTSFSESPSPLNTPLSASSDKVKASSRKRPSLMHQSSSSCDTPGPWSPSMFRAHTPVLNTPSHPMPKKRRLMSSTPSFDIDNIVIPYSMASTTRVEKLEYKEIITPSWRKVEHRKGENSNLQTQDTSEAKSEPKDDSKLLEQVTKVTKEDKTHQTKSVVEITEAPPTNHTASMDDNLDEEEDTSDDAFNRRHEKCEAVEKQKFLNFISGGVRRRTRPQSIASTPDASSAVRASSPHPLAAAVASSTSKGKQKRIILSPTPSEVELASIRREMVVVQPWTQREFPLNEQDYNALFNPPPPPKLATVTPSPSPMPMDTRSTTPTDFKLSRTPSTTSTAAVTPLSSPISTPSEETPAISPSEWTVQYNNTQNLVHAKSLVLRLSKRTV